MDTFFHYLNPFLGFCFKSNPHREDLSLLSFGFIYGLLLLSREQNRIDATVSKPFIYSSVYVRSAKKVIARNVYFTQYPKTKLLPNFVRTQ